MDFITRFGENSRVAGLEIRKKPHPDSGPQMANQGELTSSEDSRAFCQPNLKENVQYSHLCENFMLFSMVLAPMCGHYTAATDYIKLNL